MKSSSIKPHENKEKPVISVIIPVKNEERTITRVITEAKKIYRLTEVIVVCNGTTDKSAWLAKRAGAKVIQLDQELGHDVGRAIGAQHAQGSILLFIDGDFVVPAAVLRAFCQKIREGYDIALNKYSGFKNNRFIHSTSEAKRLLNRLLDRKDLYGSSLTAVPHAISREALQIIGGYKELVTPPKVQSRALLQKLKIARAAYIHTARVNRRRNKRHMEQVEELILGDHAAAIQSICEQLGPRGGWGDFLRKREYLELEASDYYMKRSINRSSNCRNVSVIISAHNEEETIEDVIKQIISLKPKEIIVVENGSLDQTLEKCKKLDVTIISYPVSLGHDVGRAIGAKEAIGEILLFVDADIIFRPYELLPFIHACSQDVDVALNNVNPFYTHSDMIDYVSMAKAFLNRALQRADLGYSSLTAIPHAIKKKAAEIIGFENLAVPPTALAMAVMNKLKIGQVKGVNVFNTNKRKSYNAGQENEVEKMILGDHIEAIHWLQNRYGERILFHNQRAVEVLEMNMIDSLKENTLGISDA